MQKKNILSRAFKDGILLLMPFGVTLGLIYWAWSVLRAFIPDLSGILPSAFLEFPYMDKVLDFVYLLIIITMIIIVGMVASTFLGRFFSFLIEKILMSPTFIRPIYLTFKKIAESVFQQEDETFAKSISESILIPYPNADTLSIGFITSNNAKHLLGEEGENWITVYVPSAPVVSAGFYLIVKKSDTSICKLSSGLAMTTIISVGAAKGKTQEIDLKLIEEIQTKKNPNPLRMWFFSGLLFLVPITGTLGILSWGFNFLYDFITNITALLPHILPNVIPDQYYDIIINLSIMVILMIIIIIIGLLGESTFGSWIKNSAQRLFSYIPMINKVYEVVEQITRVFSPDPSKSNTFDKAVLVPFPTEYTYAVGFVTGNDSRYISGDRGSDMIPIFIPTTPIPTTGWFMTYSRDKLIHLDMPIEKAFGLVISGGILAED